MTFAKILCPIDFSPTSGHALRMAIELAKTSSCELVIAHAWHAPALYFSELAYDSHVDEQLVKTAETELAAALREAHTAGLEKVSTKLLEGIAATAITSLLDTDAAFDLVVIGANGRSGLARVLMGSVAEKVVRHAPCSVMAVHSTHSIAAFRNVLCPIDFSPSSLDAFRLAKTLVAQNGSLRLLHVLDVPTSYSDVPAMAALLSELDQRSSADLDSLVASTSTGVRVGKSTRIGSPGRQILALLESEPGFDLVVMGTHGRTGVRRAILGSVAEKVVRHSPCPVIVARDRTTDSSPHS
ncbi:MAG: universal stress protein [Kofleriaceae bacterium]